MIQIIIFNLSLSPPPHTVEDMIKEVDVDGDGRIDFYEFVHALGEPEDSQENDEDDEIVSQRSPSFDVQV